MSIKKRLKPLPEAFKESPRGKLKIEDFKYDYQLKIDLPQLILGIPVDPRSEYARTYNFKPGRTWLKLAHQTSGIGCSQHYFYATTLIPRTVQIHQGMVALCNKWEGSNAGVFGVSLEQVLDYRRDLKALFNADCNNCYREFEEAIYPIDLEALKFLTAEKLPENLDELINWESSWDRACGCLGRFGLYLLGDNSD